MTKKIKMETFDEIMPMNSICSEYAGFINVLNEEFYIQVNFPKAFNKVYVKGTTKLQQILQPVADLVEQRLAQCGSITDILNELKNLLEEQLQRKDIVKLTESSNEYFDLLQQLQECGWDKVHYISPNLDLLYLKAIDDMEREHILKISIPLKFPNEPPTYEHDLPQDFQYKWVHGDTLSHVFNIFQESLMKFSAFWNNMDEIDNNTWVLEPETPRRKDCRRRIAIASTASLLLIIDPISPSSVPVCHYLGPERIVAQVRDKFNKNIYLWNEYDSLLSNLKNVLEIEFPSPSTSSKEEFCIECGICYSYQLGNAIPNMTCEDSNCNRPFHYTCLYEYIRTLPNVRHGFNKLFGECPYCNKPIWCKIP